MQHEDYVKSAIIDHQERKKRTLYWLRTNNWMGWPAWAPRKNLHAQAGAVLGVYPPVSAPASPASGWGRHPAIFSSHPPSVHQMVV